MTNLKSWLVVALVVASGLMAGGCAVSRSEVKLSAPSVEAPQASGGRVVVIRVIGAASITGLLMI